ncbi:MAG: LPXTG cell wall anchor domain-containing protein [Parasporobacterium sp.]|nr:LPXTG cell wall anchor domain-containing protein [Parasporobacterium sp.]
MKTRRKNYTIIALIKKIVLCMTLTAALLLNCFPAVSFADDELPEPSVHPSAYLTSIHIGQTVSWQPYQEYPELSVTYSSSKPDILQISEDGALTALKEGISELTASTPGNEYYRESAFSGFVEVVSSEDGLYLNVGEPHFYYQGVCYEQGELPLETERELCKHDPTLKTFLEDYLEPYQTSIPDRTEAALTALLNFAANYYTKHFAFDKVGGNAESGKTMWMELLRTHHGLCAPTASLFCYLMYLSGLPAMEVDSGGDIEHRAHTWALIEHDGYYYNFEEYDFMFGLRERYAIPPFSVSTAGYFQKEIYGDYYLHFPITGASFTPDTRMENMGQDLSEACPVLIYEHLSDGTYRARFEAVQKGRIPTYEDGMPLKLEELTYKNMESDALPSAEEEHNQVNEYAVPLFREAGDMLFAEISGLFEPEQVPTPTPDPNKTSPKTGEMEPVFFILIILVLSAASASSFILRKRKR